MTHPRAAGDSGANELTIQNDTGSSQRRRQYSEIRKVALHLAAAPAMERDQTPALDRGERTPAIEFDLVYPFRAHRKVARECGEHGLEHHGDHLTRNACLRQGKN